MSLKFESATRYTVHFCVRGFGEFPWDMLRYDTCFPRSQADVTAMLDRSTTMIEGRLAERDVHLVRHAPSRSDVTRERWRSFGWDVVEVSTQPIPARLIR